MQKLFCSAKQPVAQRDKLSGKNQILKEYDD
jgi:hypothetical protein